MKDELTRENVTVGLRVNETGNKVWSFAVKTDDNVEHTAEVSEESLIPFGIDAVIDAASNNARTNLVICVSHLMAKHS